jgi:reactive chlorine resistance protein C
MANHSAYFPGTATESLESSAPAIRRLYIKAASLDRFGMGMLRLGLVTVLVWIGGLKFASYEADGIVPLVANSPFMSFLYQYPAPEYREHMNKEGQAIPANQLWNESNGTYRVSYGLGAIIVSLGIMIALYPIWPQVSAVGSFLLILMALATLSFLVTTPEAWAPALGDPHHGFPYLSGVGRLVVKDCIMLGAAILTMADAAKTYLKRSA